MSMLGRLPPLQTIGRSQCVDLEEPPDLSDTEIDKFLNEYDRKDSSYAYEPGHAEAATNVLQTSFERLHPGGHVCKRTNEATCSFTHCKCAVSFATKYGELQHLLETRARLQLVRDYVSRINAATLFVRDVVSVAREEYETWHAVCHNLLPAPPETRLDCLSAICEDLRVHMNHWNSIKQLLHTDPFLRVLLPSICTEMDAVRTKLYQLRDSAIWWVDRLIHVGVRVLAHCDPDRLSQEALWRVTRGLEDFNSIVMAIRMEHLQEGSCLALPTSSTSSAKLSRFPQINSSLSAVYTNSYRNIGESIRPIPFPRVLNMLASERSKYAAVATQHFFTGSTDFLRLLTSNKLSEFPWLDGYEQPKSSSVKGQATGTDTSDYHSATGSHSSINTALLKVGKLIAPDLSNLPSPLVDLARREQNFAQKFLQIVCHSTDLLKKPTTGEGATGPAGTSSALPPKGHSIRGPRLSLMKSRAGPKDLTPVDGEVKSMAAPVAPPRKKTAMRAAEKESKVSASASDSSASSGRSEKRKCVSWGDVAEVAVINQLSHKYMDLLWQFFGGALYAQLVAPVWGGPENARTCLGSVSVCPDVAILLLVKMIDQTCLKDIFTTPVVQALQSISQRLQVTAAWAAWDQVFCSALASSAVDKCKPVPLAGNSFTTQTTKHFRDAYFPLNNALSVLLSDAATPNKVLAKSGRTGSIDPETSSALSNTCLMLLAPTLRRLVALSEAAAAWCNTKATHFLIGWSPAQFLLITQSDLKLIGDELRHCMAQCHCCSPEGSTSASSESTLAQQVAALMHQLMEANSQLQMLSGGAVKQLHDKCYGQAREFWEDEMPMGKIWRQKGVRELPTQHQAYVEQALDSLMEPLVSGVSKLSTTSQISVVSISVNAFFDAWTDYILQQKFKFSVVGAHQLGLDFQFVRNWLDTYLQHSDVKQSVLALDVFFYLSSVVDLLKRQPRGRSASHGAKDRRPLEERSTCGNGAAPIKAPTPNHDGQQTPSCDISVSTVSTESNWKNMGSGPTSPVGSGSSECSSDGPQSPGGTVSQPTGAMEVSSEEQHHVAKMEQWLALRVHGGSRSWRLPSCFNNTHA